MGWVLVFSCAKSSQGGLLIVRFLAVQCVTRGNSSHLDLQYNFKTSSVEDLNGLREAHPNVDIFPRPRKGPHYSRHQSWIIGILRAMDMASVTSATVF